MLPVLKIAGDGQEHRISDIVDQLARLHATFGCLAYKTTRHAVFSIKNLDKKAVASGRSAIASRIKLSPGPLLFTSL
jgi:hypothetical protein